MRGSAAFRSAVAPGGVLAGPWVKNALWRRARAVPSLDLRFAENKSLVDATTGQNLVTFTRSSRGTYVDSQGVIQRATTNLKTYSENLGLGFTQQNTTVTADSATAPDGAMTADLSVPNTTSASHASFSTGITFAASTTYTWSIFAKPSGYGNLQLTFTSGFNNNNVWANFVLQGAGSIGLQGTGVTASIQSLPDGWYRCVITGASGASATTGGPVVIVLDSNRNLRDPAFSGNGISGLFLWGAQLEQSSTVGEYIPTTSTTNSAPRFDHNPTTGESLGLLVEESRTNLVTWSQDFSQTAWSKNSSTIVATAVASPIQGVNYQKIEATSANTTVGITSVAVTAATQQRAVSFFAQPLGNISRVLVVVQGADARINVNLVDGTFTTNAAATGSTVSVSGQRFSVSTPSLTNATGVRFFLKRTGETDTNTPTTIAIGEGLYLIGAQMEAGSFPTSYIPTTTATVTRSADVASITGSNFSSWYRQDEGTMFGDSIFAANTNTRLISANTNATSNRVMITRGTGSNGNFNFVVTDASVVQVNSLVLGSNLAAGSSNKVAAAYKATDFAGSVNGSTVATQQTGTVPLSLTQLTIGNGESLSGNTMTGTIKRLTYFPTRLANETLQRITQ